MARHVWFKSLKGINCPFNSVYVSTGKRSDEFIPYRITFLSHKVMAGTIMSDWISGLAHVDVVRLLGCGPQNSPWALNEGREWYGSMRQSTTFLHSSSPLLCIILSLLFLQYLFIVLFPFEQLVLWGVSHNESIVDGSSNWIGLMKHTTPLMNTTISSSSFFTHCSSYSTLRSENLGLVRNYFTNSYKFATSGLQLSYSA